MRIVLIKLGAVNLTISRIYLMDQSLGSVITKQMLSLMSLRCIETQDLGGSQQCLLILFREFHTLFYEKILN